MDGRYLNFRRGFHEVLLRLREGTRAFTRVFLTASNSMRIEEDRGTFQHHGDTLANKKQASHGKTKKGVKVASLDGQQSM